MADDNRGLTAKSAGRKAGAASPAPAGRGGSGKDLGAQKGALRPPSPGHRLRFVPTILLVALVLGIIWMVTYFTAIIIPAGVPGVIPGQVVGSDDAPIEGALVTVEPATLNISAVTDAGGNFTLTGMQTGRTEIVISKDNFTTTTYQVYAFAAPDNASAQLIRSTFPLARGTGTASYDAAAARDQLATVCVVLFVIGNVMTAAALMGVLTKRRYSMAALGSLVGIVAIGFWMGALLNVVAFFMIRSARDQFQDQTGIIASGEIPRLRGADDDDGDGEGEEPDPDEAGDEGADEDEEGPQE